MVFSLARQFLRRIFPVLAWATCMASALSALEPYVVETVPSPDGLKVAVVTDLLRDEVGDFQITVREYSTETKTWGEPQVVGTAGRNSHPRWSPESSKLAFMSFRQDTDTLIYALNIFVINPDGSDEIQLTHNVFSGRDGWPEWSPNGSQIWFFSNRSDVDNIASYELWAMDADGSDAFGIGGSFKPWALTVRWFSANTLVVKTQSAEYFIKSDGSGIPPFPVPPPDPQVDPPPSVVLATLAPRQPDLAPLSLASVFHPNLATTQQLSPNLNADGSISSQLLGRCVKIGNFFAPILAVSLSQINFQVPAGTPTGPNTLTVFTDCSVDPPQNSPFSAVVNVQRVSPGFFRSTLMYVAAHLQDGTPVAPEGFITNAAGRMSRPAHPGETISLYGTGWGPTTASANTGEIVQEAAPLLPEASPRVTLGGSPVPAENILYIGAAPGAAGLYQLNMVLPSNLGPGDREIILRVYGKESPIGPVVAVE